MLKFRHDLAMYFSARGKIYNNNNIVTEELSSENFQTIVPQSTTNQVVTDEKDVYIGEYDRFISTSIGAEYIFFFRKWVGISASVERTFGKHEVTNWKVGIPFSLRDKDGEPKVNFELQYKHVNKKQLIGIRVGFVLGKYVG